MTLSQNMTFFALLGLGFVLLLLLCGPLKTLLKLAVRGILGGLGIYTAGLLFPLPLGVNALTLGVISLLGLPGAAALLAVGFLLK